MSKPIQRKKGFTLVEVIVVAVIVAILAGVSVPLYLGYINNSRFNQASNAAGSAASYANACINGGGAVTFTAGGDGNGGTMSCAGGMGTDASLTVPGDVALTVNLELGQVTGAHRDYTGDDAPIQYSFTPAAAAPEE